MSCAQMTLESVAALRSCDVVYSNSVDSLTAKAILDLGIPLAPARGVSYPGVIKDILKAFKKRSHIGFLTYGNPFFLNPPMSRLLAAVSPFAEVEVLPGISSFDTLINLFGLADLPEKGLFIADLNLFMKSPEFKAGPDIFFFAPFRLNAPENARFKARFLKALSAKYPGSFPACLVKCNSDPRRVEVIKGCMSCLPSLLKRCDNQHTLVLFSDERLQVLAKPPSWLPFTVLDACSCRKSRPVIR